MIDEATVRAAVEREYEEAFSLRKRAMDLLADDTADHEIFELIEKKSQAHNYAAIALEKLLTA